MRKPRAAEAIPPLVVTAGTSCPPVLRVVVLEGMARLKLRCPVCCAWARLDRAVAEGRAPFDHSRFRVPSLDALCGYVATRNWLAEVPTLQS